MNQLVDPPFYSTAGLVVLGRRIPIYKGMVFMNSSKSIISKKSYILYCPYYKRLYKHSKSAALSKPIAYKRNEWRQYSNWNRKGLGSVFWGLYSDFWHVTRWNSPGSRHVTRVKTKNLTFQQNAKWHSSSFHSKNTIKERKSKDWATIEKAKRNHQHKEYEEATKQQFHFALTVNYNPDKQRV